MRPGEVAISRLQRVAAEAHHEALARPTAVHAHHVVPVERRARSLVGAVSAAAARPGGGERLQRRVQAAHVHGLARQGILRLGRGHGKARRFQVALHPLVIDLGC